MSEKIRFTNVRAYNFRSINNSGLEVDLTATASTLVASTDNGAGKSTMLLWALFYSLFGKPYKQGTKIASLVNSRSQKACLVELEFEAKGSHWLIRRGMKPAVFDIIRDGKRVEDEAALKDYQTYLESIIGFNEKAFVYIIALGVDKFVPFCEMKAEERRTFVENMLDITVFTRMNEITKDKLKGKVKEKDQIHYDIGMLESKIQSRQRLINTLTEQLSKKSGEIGNQIETLEEQIISINEMIDRFHIKYDDVNDSLEPDVSNELQKAILLQQKFSLKLSGIEKDIEDFLNLAECPTCKQMVDEKHKNTITDGLKQDAKNLLPSKEKLEQKITEYEGKVKTRKDQESRLDEIRNGVNTLTAKRKGQEDQKSGLLKLLQSGDEQESIDRENEALEDEQNSLKEMETKLQALAKEEQDHRNLLLLLKDDAVKAEIVKQYLPFLNQKINEFLEALNLYIQFTLDEEFNITMFAPDRKGQTLESLSTGQLRRVDLAVLMAWREVGRAKASVDCNLLIMDDILNEVSKDGVIDMMHMWETMYSHLNMNLFVITQRKEDFEEYFDRCITFTLRDEYTVML